MNMRLLRFWVPVIAAIVWFGPISDSSAQILYTAPALSTATLPEGMAISTVGAKAGPAPSVEYTQSPISLSGIVLMPTAYRGKGKNTLGTALDINAAYYIGRLYGKNTLDWTLEKTNYIDRVGIWLLTADAKMLVQTESRWRPALATGVQAIYVFRDSPSPTLNPAAAQSFTVPVDKTDALLGSYVVLSKRAHPKLIASIGYMEGNVTDIFPHLSEFLTKEALVFGPYAGQTATSRNLLFAGLIWLPKPTYPLGIEFIIPQGAPASPKLINLHLGQLLKLNFEVSYLTFDGGWDLLGMFHYRYTYFPK